MITFKNGMKKVKFSCCFFLFVFFFFCIKLLSGHLFVMFVIITDSFKDTNLTCFFFFVVVCYKICCPLVRIW